MSRCVPPALQARIESRLHDFAANGLWRQLRPPRGIDFSSNDYLGFAAHPALMRHFKSRMQSITLAEPLGAPASRLLRGHLESHTELETRLAAFKGTESALLFSTGYMANLAVLTGLVEPNDRVISDAQNHASIIDGIRLCRCEKVIIPHNDREALRVALQTPYASGQTYVVTESLFSMDGDIARLDAYADLAERYQAALIIDDSHATGVYGDERASGLTEHFDVERRAVAIVSTFGKAMGTFGAFVSCSERVKQLLINAARPFIFTTAQPPYVLAAMHASLDLLSEQITAGPRARENADAFRAMLHQAQIDTFTSCGPIVPVRIGDNTKAVTAAHQLQQVGFDVRAIRPPTVQDGTARLRVSIHANHSRAALEGLATAIIDICSSRSRAFAKAAVR